jgi:predicted HicB family RNase H-like nuclease
MTVYTEGKRGFLIRIPEGMLDRIKVLAAADNRSMNIWIERALAQALAMDERRVLVAPSAVS